jgi:hypothetical protein
MLVLTFQLQRTLGCVARGARETPLMNMEPLDIYHGAEKRLNHTDNQQCDVMAAFPESPAQAGDEGARHEENEEEAEDVIPVSDVTAADRSRCKKMPEQPNHNE